MDGSEKNPRPRHAERTGEGSPGGKEAQRTSRGNGFTAEGLDLVVVLQNNGGGDAPATPVVHTLLAKLLLRKPDAPSEGDITTGGFDQDFGFFGGHGG